MKQLPFKKILLVLFALPVTACLLLFLWVLYTDKHQEQKPVSAVQPAETAVVLSTLAYPEGELNPCLVSRVAAGAELYQAGKVKTLLMSGGISRDHVVGAQVMRDLALGMGVPTEHIQLENRSATTYQNIRFSTLPLADTDRVILVSNGFHLRRSYWLARSQWPQKNIQLFAGRYCYRNSGDYLFDMLRETAAILKNGLLGRY